MVGRSPPRLTLSHATLPRNDSTTSLLTGGRCLGSKTIESHAIVQSRHLASSDRRRALLSLCRGEASVGPSKDVTRD